MKISEIKKNVNEMIEKCYKFKESFSEADNETIEGEYFMRIEDAAAIKKCCITHNLHVSFRAAGVDTIERIRNGNPCKGHTILNKSIKKKNNKWTYQTPGNVSDPDSYFFNLKGLVGYPKSDKDGQLAGLWKLEANKPVRVPIENITANMSLTDCYTGDYDMHDLFHAKKRIVAGTMDENPYIIKLNNAMAREVKRHINVLIKPEQEPETVEYALIRHGAQTMYIDYLLNRERGELKIPSDRRFLPDEDSIINIDNHIVMFDNEGKAYILNGVPEICSYYKQNGLFENIPFYYFFHSLRTHPNLSDTDKGLLNSYAVAVNELFGTLKE
jgi:hypothetical protein